jgi:hypothetical protein
MVRTAILALLFLICCSSAFCWGYWAHRKINQQAVYTLPSEMQGFYKTNINYIVDHSTDPDQRRYCSADEGPRHYINLDHYCKLPCTDFPQKWKDAVDKYGEDTIKKNGTVPWQINMLYYELVKAFQAKDKDRILDISAEMGHYIADTYVPLHATENYDGQFTDQKGIHALWETKIPEMLGSRYKLSGSKAKYTDNPLKLIWTGIMSSAAEVDSVLTIEKQLLKWYPKDEIYCQAKDKNELQLTFSDAFTKAYSDQLHGMVERRMKQSIYAIGCLWMSAWVDAGQPNLDSLK